jgi:hypothetical protein
MCTYFICLAGLLTALTLVEPVSCQEVEKPAAPAQTLCPFIRSAADQTRLEAEASARLQEAERLSTQEPDVRPAIPLEAPSPAGSPALRADRILFESFLVNWLFFEDLAPEQRSIVQKSLVRCGTAADRLSLAASIFGQLDASVRATFVGITHAMTYTELTDRQEGASLGDALGLIQELIDIQGENSALSSDHQFQLIVRLTPDALKKLERAAHFLKGENHVFHKDYPLSFRQFRRIGLRGQEAGLHFVFTAVPAARGRERLRLRQEFRAEFSKDKPKRKTAGSLDRQPSSRFFSGPLLVNSRHLAVPMATSVAATAMKSSTPVKASTTSVESTASTKLAATMEAASPKAFMLKSAASKTVMTPATSAKAAIAPAATVEASAIPRAHANEYAVYKPLRPVIAIGRAGVRVIVIISIGANWRRTNVGRSIVGWPHSDANNNSLRACKRRAKEANAE